MSKLDKTFPVVIPKRQVTQKRNATKGNMYWLVSIPNTTKEVYIPYEWLKLSSDGKTYRGSFEVGREIMGRQRNAISVMGEELKGVFPTKDGKEL